MNRQQQIDAFLLAAHELAGERLQAEPARVDQVKQQLEAWQSKVGANRSQILWNEWRDLLSQPIEQLVRSITAKTDHAEHLRSVSPMGVLITPVERHQLLQNSRRAA